jgi:hypothetical protein
MKKIATILLFILTTCSLSAQRYLDAKNINVSGVLLKNGFGANVGFERLFGRNLNSYMVEVNYTNISEKLRVKDEKAKLTDLHFLIGYRRYFNLIDNFSANIGAGGLVGYEIFTNKNSMPETVIFERKDGFQYGFLGDVGIEYYFDYFTIFGTVRPKYEFRNSEFTTSFLLGFKIYF